MLKFFFILFFIIFLTNTKANNKDRIIKNLQDTKNLNFQFEQNINGKIESGSCTIEYPKKIFCKYLNGKNKIIISNGKSLVVKTISSYYRYPLNKTSLNLILDKKILIDKIYNLKEKIVHNSYINYTIIENDNKIDFFFDNKTFDLIGWQTEDIYQNLNITLISSIKKNQNIEKDLFKIPVQN
ncbi:outer-membrane lipoprotein carrier protein LolA [Pelagibacterales bacterium SAG-MED46]|nr:outer-membrane lipoprotein carrier protein LolA [Pelagibacterales bacterium SAG-MED46]